MSVDRKSSIRQELYGLGRSMAADVVNRTTIIVTLLLILAVVTGFFKGLDEGRREGFTLVADTNGDELLEDPIELSYEPFDITIYRSYILDGARVFEMRIVNTSSRPAKLDGLLADTFELELSGVPDKEQPKFQLGVIRVDGEYNRPTEFTGIRMGFSVNPKVPMDVAVVFQENDDNPKTRSIVRPEQADLLTVWSYEWRPGRIDHNTAWWRGQQVAEIVLK